MSNALVRLSREDVAAYLARRIAFAHRGAGMVHRFLRSFGLTGTLKRPRPVHPEVLLELWGILQLALWEASGLRGLMAAELPPAAEAFLDLRRRLVEAPEEYLKGNSGTELSQRVTEAWLRCCDPLAPAYLDVDVVAVGKLPESFMQSLADFLWAHRNLVQPE